MSAQFTPTRVAMAGTDALPMLEGRISNQVLNMPGMKVLTFTQIFDGRNQE
jgi:hypothetical protein